jgi:nucleoid-associated protein YgaU
VNIASPTERAPQVADIPVSEPTSAAAISPSFLTPPLIASPDPVQLAESAASQAVDKSPAISTISSSIPVPDANPLAAATDTLVHVIHEGDSLDRLAKRYLGDEARALEIFDLNRDILDNPHVLRIGVELRIPVTERASD